MWVILLKNNIQCVNDYHITEFSTNVEINNISKMSINSCIHNIVFLYKNRHICYTHAHTGMGITYDCWAWLFDRYGYEELTAVGYGGYLRRVGIYYLSQWPRETNNVITVSGGVKRLNWRTANLRLFLVSHIFNVWWWHKEVFK